MAAITHRHDEFHRGLVPEDQLADDTPTAGYVVTATGTGEAEWAPGGGGTSGLVLTYDDANFAAADPGNGVFRANNADPTIASVLYIDDLDANGVNIQPWIDTWNNEAFGYLRLRSVSDPETFITYRVTDYTNDTGFSQVDVEYVGGVAPLTGAGDTGIEFWPNAYPGVPEIDSLLTPETDPALVLGPDGSGGVEFRPEGAATGTLNFVIDGGGSAITTGVKGDLMVHYAGTITEWEALADQSGSIVVDIWRDTYANFPPVVGDSITGAEKPTISAATKGQDTSLASGAGWAVAAGDILRFNVDSITTCQRVTIALKFVRA